MTKDILGPETRKAATYAVSGLAKIGTIACVSATSGKILKEAINQYSLGMLAHVDNVKEALRR